MISPLIDRLTSVDVVEAFSPPRVTEEAKKFGLRAGEAWDLTEGWDFRLESHRKAALKYQAEEGPLVVIGSPPCTPFSQLQTMSPMDEKAMTRWDEGVEHMKFVIQLYRNQLNAGRVFLHEHPANAKSWSLEEIQKLGREEGVTIYRADQCMYGLKTWGQKRGQLVAAKKPTKFMTNSRALGRQLETKCDGGMTTRV